MKIKISNFRLYLTFLMTFLGVFISNEKVQAIHAKVDVAPAYVRMDVLESEKTVKTTNMAGIRADATILVYEGTGYCVKPTLLYTFGHNNLFTGGVGFGHYTPVLSWLSFTPTVGVTYSRIRTTVPLKAMMQKFHLREKFHCISPYIGLETNFCFKPWRASIILQYAWSRTFTKITGLEGIDFGNQRSNSKGPLYGLVIERDIDECWSVGIGAAYNIGLTKEKHGFRIMGCKVGVTRWF